jgi:uncharacterized protein
MAHTALITGSSSGLGAEYARQLAARGMDLILVARRADALERVAEEARRAHGVAVEVLVADLLDRDDLDRVASRLQDAQHPVDMLVNNAGVSLPLAFETVGIDDEVAHLRLHVEAAMRLMSAALPGMLARGRGRIVNVASVAGLGLRGTYGAAKAWLIHFSRWANVTYRDRGVTVTAVCPGVMREGFHEKSGVPEGVPAGMVLRAADVAAESLRDVARGRSVSVPSARYRWATRLTRLLPDAVLVRSAARVP